MGDMISKFTQAKVNLKNPEIPSLAESKSIDAIPEK